MYKNVVMTIVEYDTISLANFASPPLFSFSWMEVSFWKSDPWQEMNEWNKIVQSLQQEKMRLVGKLEITSLWFLL